MGNAAAESPPEVGTGYAGVDTDTASTGGAFGSVSSDDRFGSIDNGQETSNIQSTTTDGYDGGGW